MDMPPFSLYRLRPDFAEVRAFHLTESFAQALAAHEADQAGTPRPKCPPGLRVLPSGGLVFDLDGAESPRVSIGDVLVYHPDGRREVMAGAAFGARYVVAAAAPTVPVQPAQQTAEASAPDPAPKPATAPKPRRTAASEPTK